MQRLESVSKIFINTIAIIFTSFCVRIIRVIGVVVVDLMSMYHGYQTNRMQYHQMCYYYLGRCASKRFTTTSQKHLHNKNHNRWHCSNQNNFYVLGHDLLSTMRRNMQVMMLGE